MKLLPLRASLQLAPHEDIRLFVSFTTEVMLRTARELAHVVGYPAGLELDAINARAQATAQHALHEGRADVMTWALLGICALIDGAKHLQTLTSPMQLQLRDALDSAQYAYGLLATDVGLPEALPELYFDGLARIACAREHSVAERREFASEAEAAFVRTVREAVAEGLNETATTPALDLHARILANAFVDRVSTELVVDEDAYSELCALLRELAGALGDAKLIDRELALTLYCMPQLVRNAFLACPADSPLRNALEDCWVELDALVMDCFVRLPQ